MPPFIWVTLIMMQRILLRPTLGNINCDAIRNSKQPLGILPKKCIIALFMSFNNPYESRKAL